MWRRVFEKRRRVDLVPDSTAAAQGADLVRQCENFLSGKMAKTLISTRGRIPNWAWVNFLAHASESELRTVAQEDYSRGLLSIYDAWRYAQISTASAVLTVSDACLCSVEEIQRRALVPLELELAIANDITPDEFTAMVFNALEHC